METPANAGPDVDAPADVPVVPADVPTDVPAVTTGADGDALAVATAAVAVEGDVTVEQSAGTSPIRPGELVPAWRVASVSAWVLVVFAYSAVWKTSVELGIGTWWLGARSSPQPLLVHLIPFAVAIAFGLVSSYSFRRLPIINMVGALLLASIAIPDFSRSIGIAVIELVIAASVLLVAVGSLTGVVKTGDR
jgi:hypothetical protein